MIFNLLSECLPYPFHPKGKPRFMVSYPLCFVLKSVSLSLFPMPVSYR